MHVWNQGLGWAPTQASDDVNLQPSGGRAATAQALASVFSFSDPTSWTITMSHKPNVTRAPQVTFCPHTTVSFHHGNEKEEPKLAQAVSGLYLREGEGGSPHSDHVKSPTEAPVEEASTGEGRLEGSEMRGNLRPVWKGLH